MRSSGVLSVRVNRRCGKLKAGARAGKGAGASRSIPIERREAPRCLRAPFRLAPGVEAVLRLRVVAPLLRLLLVHETPRQGGELVVGLAAGRGQPGEVAPQPPRAHF